MMASLREILDEIQQRRGDLTPAILVEEARPRTSPLHSRFVWEDKTAGHSFRLIQAANLIRSVKVKYADDDAGSRTVRRYLPVRGPEGTTYQPSGDVLVDPVQRAIVLRDMERDWLAFKRRYAHMAEFAELISAELAEKAA